MALFMGLLTKPLNKVMRLVEALYPALPVRGIERPVFIIGCGRSGTTILGTALSRHDKVTYLNEPRKLWSAVYPETDIWPGSPAGNGKLVLGAADADAESSRRLARLFRFQTLRSGRPLLVEKLPVNSFRLPFVHAVFRDARFVYIARSGLEVARSIEKLCEAGRWYSRNPNKWNQLALLAATMSDTANLPAICTGNYEKGLLEWRLSTEIIEGFLDGVPADVWIRISYAELVDHQVDTILKVMAFLGVDTDEKVTAFVRENISRRSDKLVNQVLSETEKLIGGDYLLRTRY
jgi:hypothetical protein